MAITNASLFDVYTYEYERNRSLLEFVHELFQQQTNLDKIIFQIMQKARDLLFCQRCSVLLIVEDDGKVDMRKAFDLFDKGNKSNLRRHR
jgi:dual 3',5'-cyclic-AMP and -GMP phosphodiesterase 11